MRITGNLVNINPFLQKRIPSLAKGQSKNAVNDNYLENIQFATASGQPKKNNYRVYIKTDDMLFSGGNGTGLSFYIKYAENSTTEDPTMIAKGVDENGNEFEQTIRIRDINPHNATIVEIRALEAYLNVDKGKGLSSLPPDAGNLGLNDKRDFIAMFRKTINDMNLLGEQLIAHFYTRNMKVYEDFLQSKTR